MMNVNLLYHKWDQEWRKRLCLNLAFIYTSIRGSTLLLLILGINFTHIMNLTRLFSKIIFKCWRFYHNRNLTVLQNIFAKLMITFKSQPWRPTMSNQKRERRYLWKTSKYQRRKCWYTVEELQFMLGLSAWPR
jgi:hypothetical protein